uniref:Uncharacterized protein n=1 Tax=Steinernema glaseri TaxID=37863 RepID=A0A1I8ACB0_9BILA
MTRTQAGPSRVGSNILITNRHHWTPPHRESIINCDPKFVNRLVLKLLVTTGASFLHASSLFGPSMIPLDSAQQ